MTTQIADAQPIDTQPVPALTSSGNPMTKVLRLRDFRLLWIGQGTSLLGDQFYLIALPWLVLQLTHDPLALGFVLALAGVPRALFMLVGGAITDRFSPRVVMLTSDVIRLVCISLAAFLVMTGSAQLWMLYALSLIFGLVSGFFMPASTAIVPTLVDEQDLHAGNAVFQGTAQLSAFLGPALAGGLIAWGEHWAGGQAGTAGIALAFGIDALTFAVSIVTLALMRDTRPSASPAGSTKQNVLESIQQGILYAWQEPLLRVFFGLIAVMNLFFAGPLMVGVPVLASTRLPEGAAAFGLILSGYAGGNLGGYFAAGSLPRIKRIGLFMPVLVALFGAGLMGLGLITSTWVGFAMLLVLGAANGYVAITLITWMQRTTSKDMLGRVMSLMLFFNVGLIPISQALAGGLIKLSMLGLFEGCGAAIVLVGAWTAFLPLMRQAEI